MAAGIGADRQQMTMNDVSNFVNNSMKTGHTNGLDRRSSQRCAFAAIYASHCTPNPERAWTNVVHVNSRLITYGEVTIGNGLSCQWMSGCPYKVSVANRFCDKPSGTVAEQYINSAWMVTLSRHDSPVVCGRSCGTIHVIRAQNRTKTRDEDVTIGIPVSPALGYCR